MLRLRCIFLGHHKIAVIGSGPSAFYTIKNIDRNFPSAEYHIYERLPKPFGLARYGVAPDHPEVKNVMNEFNTIAKNIGHRICASLNHHVDSTEFEEISKKYSAVLIASGASENPNNNFDAISARDMCFSSNGMPQVEFPIKHVNLKNIVIIGNGNVALDATRLFINPLDVYYGVSDFMINWKGLIESIPENIYILGRRGYEFASFTNRELRELVNLATVIVDPKDLEENMSNFTRAKQRGLDILKPCIDNYHELLWTGDIRPIEGRLPTRIHFIFNSQVENIEIMSPPKHTHVKSTILSKPQDISIVNKSKNTYRILKQIDTVIRSTGFNIRKDFPLEYTDKNIMNENGGHVGNNVFVTGWARTGPKGNIASCIPGCAEVGKSISEYLKKLPDNICNDSLQILSKPGSQYIKFPFFE